MSCHDNTQIMNVKGLTSVKYSGQMPGGNTSINLFGGYGDDDKKDQKQQQTAPVQEAPPTMQKDEEEKQPDEPVQQ